MAKYFLAVLAAGAVAAIGMMPDAARARDSPFCIKGGGYDSSLGDCSFATYEQCQASASGTRSSCGVNPRYAHRRHPVHH